MAVLTVRKYGDPILRRRAEPVGEVTPEIRAILRDMIDTMYREVGVGLAAPQVGISLRLMVIDEEKGRGPRALVNPEIVDQGGRVVAEEGCLSIPGVFAPVARAEWVRLEAQDEEGQPVTVETKGLYARVIQHEMDHLDGVLILDRTTKEQRKEAIRTMREREREEAEQAA